MQRRTEFTILAGLLLFALGAFAPGAIAADEAEEPKKTEEMTEEELLEKARPQASERITVTARKREESLQEVPVAVTVVQGDQLLETGAENLEDLQLSVPNLSIYAGRNQSTTLTAFMRGIGQADPLWGVDPGVGLYLDDVYIARPQGALLDVYDVERIEVLRGPQGTLYGKNTIGGAIRYISRQLTDVPEAHISVTPGNFSTKEIRAGVSGPLVEGKLRGKVAFASLERDGWGTNLVTGEDVNDRNTTAFRAALDWLPSDTVKVGFSFDWTDDDANPKGYTRLATNPLCPLFLGGAPCPPLDTFDVQAGLEPRNGTTSKGYSMTIGWDISDAWTFKSISAYRESDTENFIDFDTTQAPIADVKAFYGDDQTTQEFQFLYDNGGRLSGVLGAYYFDGEAGGLVQNNFFGSIFGTTDGRTLTESVAIFGDGSLGLTDKLTFNFGLRYTDEEKNGIAFNAGYADDTFTTITAVVADYDKTESFEALSPRLGLDYRFTENVMGYVSASRGFKSGGFNVRAQSQAFPESAEPFDDEQLTVLEVGTKSLLADRQVVLNAAAFYGDYEDIQVSTFTDYDSDGDGVNDAFFGNFLNAGSATLKGAELELDWSPREVSWFRLAANVSWLDAEPDEFLDANNDGFVDTQVITNAPEFTGAIRPSIYLPSKAGLFSAGVEYGYRDDSVLTNEGGEDPNSPGNPLMPIVQDSYSLVNAFVSFRPTGGHWRFSVNGHNLTDEEYLTNGYNIPVLGVLTGSYGQPRTVTATVGYNFF